MVQAGIDVIVMIGDKPVAGQTNAILHRSMSPIEITNKITGEWKDYLAGARTWRVSCNGVYVVNEESLDALEQAFMNNKEVTVSIGYNNKNYFGRALIIDFPLSSQYNAQFKYTLTLLGVGELNVKNN